MGSILRCVASEKPKQWDAALPQIEFAFNTMVNISTGKAPFEVVYTKFPNQTIDLITLPQYKSTSAATLAEQIANLHFEVHQKLEANNLKYKAAADRHRRFKAFQEGDLVMVFLRRERFPVGTYSKLSARKIGPCRILRKISDNAYAIALPAGMQISNVFNVADLYAYQPLDDAPIQVT